jgi:DNA-binding MarR family transcriptional regulator
MPTKNGKTNAAAEDEAGTGDSGDWGYLQTSGFLNEVDGTIAKLILQVRNFRRLRARYFDPEIFGEPAWDILLELYEAELTHQRVQVSAACIGSGVPGTTALRCLHMMEARGLVERSDDPTDARRIFVYLSHEARTAMGSLFGALQERTAKLQLDR